MTLRSGSRRLCRPLPREGKYGTGSRTFDLWTFTYYAFQEYNIASESFCFIVFGLEKLFESLRQNVLQPWKALMLSTRKFVVHCSVIEWAQQDKSGLIKGSTKFPKFKQCTVDQKSGCWPLEFDSCPLFKKLV